MFALNGDELLGVDLRDLLDRHRVAAPAATIVVSQVRSPFGVVDVVRRRRDRRVPRGAAPAAVGELRRLRPRRRVASSGLPERGDHELTTFPELAAEGKLRAYRNESFWITVNTPKQLREAEAFVQAHPELAAVAA